LLFNGEHGENGDFKPSPENYEEISEHFKLSVTKAEAEYQASPDEASLLAAASAHNLYAQVVNIKKDVHSGMISSLDAVIAIKINGVLSS
jgi:hypothetical protein